MKKIKHIKVTSYKNNIEQSTIIYLYTFNDLDKNDELPLRILNHRLGESANSLLFREVRENRGIAYDIYYHLDITQNLKIYIYIQLLMKKILKKLQDAIEDNFISNIKFRKYNNWQKMI